MKRVALVVPTMWLFAWTVPVSAASVSKSIDIKQPADKIWAMIGPFCAIKDWHPAIGECTEADGVRTLTTKDGKGQFIEKETANDPRDMAYTYAIQKSPLPVSEYTSTLKVTPKDKGSSTVQWSSTYTPEKGKEQDAQSAITGIYQAGLSNIQKMASP